MGEAPQVGGHHRNDRPGGADDRRRRRSGQEDVDKTSDEAAADHQEGEAQAAEEVLDVVADHVVRGV